MKMVVIMYLEEDQDCVKKLLADHEVETFSLLPVEGVGPGGKGWYGHAAPYRSQMILAAVEEKKAQELLDAVSECRSISDPRHPVRAMQIPVEATSVCDGASVD